MKREGGKDRKRDKERLKQRDGETWGGLNPCKRHGETVRDGQKHRERKKLGQGERSPDRDSEEALLGFNSFRSSGALSPSSVSPE